VYVLTVAKRSKPLAFEQVKYHLKPWLRNGNAGTQKLRLKQTVVNTKVPCTARTVLCEWSKRSIRHLAWSRSGKWKSPVSTRPRFK